MCMFRFSVVGVCDGYTLRFAIISSRPYKSLKATTTDWQQPYPCIKLSTARCMRLQGRHRAIAASHYCFFHIRSLSSQNLVYCKLSIDLQRLCKSTAFNRNKQKTMALLAVLHSVCTTFV